MPHLPSAGDVASPVTTGLPVIRGDQHKARPGLRPQGLRYMLPEEL